jgi:hypothetical protein
MCDESYSDIFVATRNRSACRELCSATAALVQRFQGEHTRQADALPSECTSDISGEWSLYYVQEARALEVRSWRTGHGGLLGRPETECCRCRRTLGCPHAVVS